MAHSLKWCIIQKTFFQPFSEPIEYLHKRFLFSNLLMRNQIKNLVGFVHSYGVLKGTSLLLKTEFDPRTLKVPHVKHSIALRPKTSDLPTFLQVFAFGEYKINLDNPKVIIDAGANIGLFSIYMKNKFPDAMIICIEPDGENFEVLKQNLSFYSKIHLENCGLWNKDVRLKVNEEFNFGKWGVMVKEDENGDIPAVSIGTLMEKYALSQIDVLKIDIETSEKQLFSGNYEAWLPRVKTIIIELHDGMLSGCSKTFFEAINRTFNDYEMKTKGENVIIVNNDIP
jgi:FkbM family methyltransferase